MPTDVKNTEVLDGTKSWIPSPYDILPPSPGTSSPEEYARFFEDTSRDSIEMSKIGEDISNSSFKSVFDFIAKAISPPPSAFSFARISNMPDLYNKGVIAWPGIPPNSLAKIAKENVAPLMIIGMRVDDVYRYANYSKNDEPWRPGWSIVLESNSIKQDNAIKRDIDEAVSFLLNCNSELKDFRERDKKELTSFRTFLGALTRDSLTFDGMAVWTDTDSKGRVKAFKALSAQNIRLANPKEGYLGNKDIFAVGVDETGNIKEEFSRYDLIWTVRNPRADSQIYNYGFSEIEQAVRLIQGFQNALDLNIDRFNRSSIPNGMFVFTGQGWVRAQLDRLARLFINMKRGVTKSWTIPIIMAPKDAKVDLLDFSNIKGSEIYYQDFMNLVVGAFSTIYRFPVNRLGYRASGKGPDNKQDIRESGPILSDTEDPGLAPLLDHIEHLVNMIVQTRWPHLRFVFRGKSPKEDAREFESRMLAMTVDERRTAVGLPPLHESDFVKKLDESQKKQLVMMGSCPIDPGLAGVYQMLVAQNVEDATGGARFGAKIDPAESEKHGHMSGVRRDSAKEAESAESNKNKSK